MTLDATVPIDQVINALWPTYVREDREEINLLWRAIVAANSTETTYEMTAGQFSMEVGLDLADVIIELVSLTATVAVNLTQITDGSGGMVKVIKAGDGNVTVKHNVSYIDLAGGTDLTLSDGDILVLINTGGDPDELINGVWYEVSRSGAAVGEINTASNVGGGAGLLYKQKTGVDLEFKTVLAGTGISVDNNASDITVNATGGGASEIAYNTVNMAAAQTELVTDTDINNVVNEVIPITADVAVNLTTMTLGLAGAVKTIIAADDDITVIQDKASVAGGTFSLNSPAGVDLAMSTGDILCVVNIGGDGALVSGYWMELYRTLRV